MGKNSNLHNAKNAKEDNFYTKLSDIENELYHYKKHFKDKVILCNCDDPFESNFFKYFAMNFNHLGLKKLIATCYHGSPIAGEQLLLPLFNDEETRMEHGYKIELDSVPDVNGDGCIDLDDIEKLLKTPKYSPVKLKGDGDFRSQECIDIIKREQKAGNTVLACTNPPFSLMREYIDFLFTHDLEFLIISTQNAITYKEVFPLLRDNKMWLGYKSGDMAFMVPDYFEPRATRYWQDASGQKWRSLGNVCWFTNLDHDKRHEDLILWKKYSEEPELYPHYDNYDAVEVSKVANIPCDYKGVMGVPITFLDKYCPEQFEIIDINPHFFSIVANGGEKPKQLTLHSAGKKDPYARILIRNKHPLVDSQ